MLQIHLVTSMGQVKALGNSNPHLSAKTRDESSFPTQNRSIQLNRSLAPQWCSFRSGNRATKESLTKVLGKLQLCGDQAKLSSDT